MMLGISFMYDKNIYILCRYETSFYNVTNFLINFGAYFLCYLRGLVIKKYRNINNKGGVVEQSFELYPVM